MARIGLMDTLVAAAVGVVDIAAEEYAGGTLGGTPVRGKDLVRAGITAGTVAANIVPVRPIPYTDVAFYASLPLLEKTVRDLIKGTTTTAAGRPTGLRLAAQPVSLRAAEVKAPEKVEVKAPEKRTEFIEA